MIRLITSVVWVLFCLGFGQLRAETSPFGTALAEGRENLIEVDLPAGEAQAPSGLTYKVKAATYHYQAYIPEGYYDNPLAAYPCLFIASPSGNAGMQPMADWLKKNRWVVVMLVESKNDDAEAQVGNFIVAHDDAVKRLRIDAGLKVATGISGGASASSLNVVLRDGFAGAICQAGGFFYQQGFDFYAYLKAQPELRVHVLIGRQDAPKVPVMQSIEPRAKELDNLTAEWFEGGHTWAPQNMTEKALDLMQAHAFRTYFERGWQQVETSEQVADRTALYRRLEQLVWIGKKIAPADPAVSEQVKVLEDRLRTVRQDKQVRTHLSILQKFWKIQEIENQARTEENEKQRRAMLAQVAAQYRSFGSRYEELPEGRLADQSYEAIRREISKP